MSDAVLDTVVYAETPESISIGLRPAGVASRLYAFLLDGLIRSAILYLISLATVSIGGLGIAFTLILFFALEWLYPVVFELSPLGGHAGQARAGAESGHGQRAADHTGGVVHAQFAALRRLLADDVRLRARQHARSQGF